MCECAYLFSGPFPHGPHWSCCLIRAACTIEGFCGAYGCCWVSQGVWSLRCPAHRNSFQPSQHLSTCPELDWGSRTTACQRKKTAASVLGVVVSFFRACQYEVA